MRAAEGLSVAGLFALVALAAPVARPRPASARVTQQSPVPRPARLVAFTNEPREPELGEVFELRLQVRVGPGTVAFFPDTLVEALQAVSAGRGTWEEAIGPADSLDVRATYPVMGLNNGGLTLPSLEVWTRPATDGERPGAHAVAELAEPPSEGRNGLERVLIPIGGVLVIPIREMAQEDEALVARQPADVMGGEWSPWRVLMLVALLVAGALQMWWWASGRARVATNGGPAPLRLSSRAEALAELDRIRGSGWQGNGRVVDFYDATTGVLRRYSGVREPRWGEALTSSELLARMRERWGDEPVSALGGAVWAAERVKFGDHRPDAATADAHWATVRAWIAARPDDR